MAAFEIGDLVQLKSGGPKMVISGGPYGSNHNQYDCEWFAGSNDKRARYHEGALEPWADKK